MGKINIMPSRNNNNVLDSLNAFTISSTLIVSGFIVIAAKKLLDLAFSGVLLKYTQSIKGEVETQLAPLKEDMTQLRFEITEYRKNSHEKSSSAHTVLNAALDLIHKYDDELRERGEGKNGK